MLKKIMFISVLVLCFSSAAIASQKKTPASCAALGTLEIKCFQCTKTKSKYVGTAKVKAAYEEGQGSKYCIPAKAAAKACWYKYGGNMVVREDGQFKSYYGFSGTYWTGLHRHTERYNTTCIRNAGH